MLRPLRPEFPAFVLACALLLAAGAPERAQAQASGTTMQVGGGLIPGLGAQVGGVQAGQIFTREVLLQLDYRPAFAGLSGGVQTSLAFGGAVRVYGILRTIGNENARLYPFLDHIDLGFRIGPGLFFVPDETRADKNQRFRPFFDPYLRLTSDAFGERPVYLELGPQRPIIRAGVWLTF